jgi:two-component system, NarL family, response regulator DegU
LKDSSGALVLEAIRTVHRGEAYLQSSIGHKIIRQGTMGGETHAIDLTRREFEILSLIVEGASNKDIAHKLVISERTVYGHVYNIMAKLQVSSRAQAVSFAIKNHLVQMENSSGQG